MNIASGCPVFVAQTVLENGTYIKDDTIFIKVIVDTSDLPDPWPVTGEVDWAEGISSGGFEPAVSTEVLALRKGPCGTEEAAEGGRGPAGGATREDTPDMFSNRLATLHSEELFILWRDKYCCQRRFSFSFLKI